MSRFRQIYTSLRRLNFIGRSQPFHNVLPRQLHVSATSLQPFNLGKVNHVAIAVPDLEKATAFYRDVLGGTVSEPQALPEHGVYTVFVELGDTKIELLHPLGEKSPISGFLEKNPAGGMHHICLEVDNINGAVEHISSSGVRPLAKEPKIGAHGKPVIFLHPKDCGGVLVEIEEA